MKESQKHPEYDTQILNWNLMRDAYRGQRQTKSKNTLYLPATSGHIADGMHINQPGYKAYQAYLMRARFPNFLREAVQSAVGRMHSHPAKFELPDEMKDIRSSKGETLSQLLRRINEEQLITGRIGILADIWKNLPYLATYSAERITNWDNGSFDILPQVLNFVVLEESEYIRDGFEWTMKEKYRILRLDGDGYIITIDDSEIRPSRFGRKLGQIPFVIINSCDLVADTDEPPLMDLGELCMTVYRGEADYRQALFMQGQDTLVIVGGTQDEDESIRTGAGSRIDVPMNGDAKYIGVESSGLSEQREALIEDRKRAGSMGAQSLDTVSRERESGVSLGIRVAARTADLNQVALTGAAGLEAILKMCAEWMGLSSDGIVVTPNLEFGNSNLTGEDMIAVQTARNLGYPVSAQTLHKMASAKGITELTYDEEKAEAEKEVNSVFEKAENGDRAPEQSMKG
jgi:hypothetical protein